MGHALPGQISADGTGVEGDVEQARIAAADDFLIGQLGRLHHGFELAVGGDAQLDLIFRADKAGCNLAQACDAGVAEGLLLGFGACAGDRLGLDVLDGVTLPERRGLRPRAISHGGK